MANPEHLEKIHLGSQKWNAWREENPEIVPDLERAELVGMIARRINLEGANLRHANLRSADLREANLKRANLYRAHLQGTDLVRANLQSAILDRAVLDKTLLGAADFTDATFLGTFLIDLIFAYTCLKNANLRGARLFRVDFTTALLDNTTFPDGTLHDVTNIE